MTENTRQAFEKFARAHLLSTTRSRQEPDFYDDIITEGAWCAWTASRKAALEEGAAKCESLCWALDHGGNKYFRAAHAEQCAAAIRAEIDK